MGPHKHHGAHLHNPTGITDEAAIEGHDLIANAEREEQKLHPTDSMTEDPNLQSHKNTGAPGSHQAGGHRKGSIVEKVKDALNMKK